MSKRGVAVNDIERVISKTGFYDAMELCPEEQMQSMKSCLLLPWLLDESVHD